MYYAGYECLSEAKGIQVGLQKSWNLELECPPDSLSLSRVFDSHWSPASFSLHADWLSLLSWTSWPNMVEAQLLSLHIRVPTPQRDEPAVSVLNSDSQETEPNWASLSGAYRGPTSQVLCSADAATGPTLLLWIRWALPREARGGARANRCLLLMPSCIHPTNIHDMSRHCCSC